MDRAAGTTTLSALIPSRTLSMDAVQGRQLGAPGDADGGWAPVALLPFAGLSPLLTRKTRSGPNRDRFRAVDRPCLDAASIRCCIPHRASKSVSKGLRDARGRRRCPASTTSSAFRPARQQVSGGTRKYPLDQRHRDDLRPPGPGRGHQRRYGPRRQVARRPLQQAGIRAVSTTTSMPCVRATGCMMEGYFPARRPLARGALETVKPVLGSTDKQPTSPSRAKNHRWRSARTSGARFAGYGWKRSARDRRQRPHDASRMRTRTFQNTKGIGPTFIIVDSHIGLRARAHQAGHACGAWASRSARGGDTGGPRRIFGLARGCSVSGAARRLPQCFRRYPPWAKKAWRGKLAGQGVGSTGSHRTRTKHPELGRRGCTGLQHRQGLPAKWGPRPAAVPAPTPQGKSPGRETRRRRLLNGPGPERGRG